MTAVQPRSSVRSAVPAVELEENAVLEERPQAYQALYAHWERTHWSTLELDLDTDKRSFDALDEGEQGGLLWIFAHRFHAEFNVARLLAPFLLAAPEYELQLLLATEVADEHRHLQAVLRISRKSLGLRAASRRCVRSPIATSIRSPRLYGRLEHYVSRLSAGSDEDEFLAAVIAYHLLAEGVIARTAQNLAAGQYERLAFPGLAEGQRLVAREHGTSGSASPTPAGSSSKIPDKHTR